MDDLMEEEFTGGSWARAAVDHAAEAQAQAAGDGDGDAATDADADGDEAAQAAQAAQGEDGAPTTMPGRKLPDPAARMVGLLLEELRKAGLSKDRPLHLFYASDCSGADAPAFAWKAIIANLKERGLVTLLPLSSMCTCAISIALASGSCGKTIRRARSSATCALGSSLAGTGPVPSTSWVGG